MEAGQGWNAFAAKQTRKQGQNTCKTKDIDTDGTKNFLNKTKVDVDIRSERKGNFRLRTPEKLNEMFDSFGQTPNRNKRIHRLEKFGDQDKYEFNSRITQCCSF